MVITSCGKNTSVDSAVFLGSYEQDNNTTNGKEEIEWIILARESDRVLVISRYALDCLQYNESYTKDVTWETCSLRKWLNDVFLNTAFTESEREKIHSMTVSADKNPDYDTDPGNNTTDPVFLLSNSEVLKYSDSDITWRQCIGTAYCNARGAFNSSDNRVKWWLRSPGESSYTASFAGSINGINYIETAPIDMDSITVRPAMWIKLE